MFLRPEKDILQRLDDIPRVEPEPDERRDRIIVGKAVEEKLSGLGEDVKDLVTEELSRSAQGSAIWIKMVVELLEMRQVRALTPMRAFLDRLPQPDQLSQLYSSLLSCHTSDDLQNQGLAISALETFAISRRPLTILEVAWAATLSCAKEDVTSVAALAGLVDHQRVMALIRPFVALVDFDDTKRCQVRLVHQSVEEFVLEGWTSTRHGLQHSDTSPTTDDAQVKHTARRLEASILNNCIRYLLLVEIGLNYLFSEGQEAIEAMPQEYDLFGDHDEPANYDPTVTWETWEENMVRYDPSERGLGELFVYASCHWVEHFGAVEVDSPPGLASIETLCQAGSLRLKNWTEQFTRPQCTIQRRFVFDSRLYDPLSITSLYGSEAMLQMMLEGSDFSTVKFLPNSPMVVVDQILRWGDKSRIKLLFLIMRAWSFSGMSDRGWDTLFDLVDGVLETMIRESWGSELLQPGTIQSSGLNSCTAANEQQALRST
ncbi:Uu.00g025150.m01.CDS01 [Anthostomella pinea]|uniref:Uu.00g025150.m01.CDS01 n=1 Tax=Anthostomella pinea TaxID=933095 RepID=A0AAI8V7U9_9PEZI|nr:Uu.00g025150.m01.CDS01 [Anthostomella pinea]